ncbi:MAG: ABC transporter permease [Bacteroidota bacterium]
MLKNYFKVALRSILKRPGTTAINVTGLGVGLACAILVLSYIQTERAYDRFHDNADRIYRVVKHEPNNVFQGVDRYGVTPAGMGPHLRNAAGVETASTFSQRPSLLQRGEDGFVETGVLADPHFFDVFSFPLLRGDPATALDDPDAVVLTASMAEKLFGNADPIGQTVRFDDRADYTVTGIAAEPPETSHFSFAFVRSILSDAYYQDNLGSWTSSSWSNYVVLEPGHEVAALEAHLVSLMEVHQPEAIGETQYVMQPITAIHLGDPVNFGTGEPVDVRLLYLFGAIALVILLLACVNYTNLAVARSTLRAREVGVRKVLGGRPRQLAGQYLGESIVTAFLALGVGFGLAALARPAFALWLERDLVLGGPMGWPFFVVMLGGTLVVGILAGAYPAYVLARVRPSEALGSGEAPLGRARLRALLVVGQYAAAIGLVIGSLVIYQQMAFIQSQPLGFDKEHVVGLRLRGVDVQQELPGFRAALAEVPGVVRVSGATDLPTNIRASSTLAAWEGHPEVEGEEFPIYQVFVDHEFFEVYNMSLASGRSFRPTPADSSGAFIVNETAANQLGWTTETAVGKTVQWGEQDVPVVGVVEDFHMHAMHLPIAPLLIGYAPNWVNQVSIRVASSDLPETLAGIEAAWAERSPYPFEVTFLDEEFDALYKAEAKLGQGIGYFTIIALFVACLGLFGLATHAAEQRTREIGIRKVLGASVAGLVGLMSRGFLKLVGLAFLIAAPVAYVSAARWLDGFAYRTDLGVGVFVLAGGLALVVALVTVGGHALRAALSDPVRALRSD